RGARITHWQAKLNSATAVFNTASSHYDGARRTRPDWTMRYIRGEISTDQWQSGDPVLNGFRATANDAERQIANAHQSLEACRSMRIFFESPPAPIATSRTDADGRFNLVLPAARPVLVMAQASRA